MSDLRVFCDALRRRGSVEGTLAAMIALQATITEIRPGKDIPAPEPPRQS